MTANNTKTPARTEERAATRKVLKLNRRNRATEDRIPVFTMPDESGEEQTYTIPSKVSRGSALKMIRVFTQDGDMAAIAAMLEDMLGLDGYKALEESDLDDETFDYIIETIQAIVMGENEGKGE